MQDYKQHAIEFEQRVEKMIKQLANVEFEGNLIDYYNTFSSSCKKLVDQMKNFYTPDENGDYPKMTLAQRDDFLTYYANVIESAKEIRKVNKTIKPLNEVANYISVVATSDIKALIKMDEEKDLPSIIEDARTKTIDITGTNFDMVGNNLSKRMVIENNGKKAVFTADSSYNEKKATDDYKDKYIKSYPEFQKLTSVLCHNFEFLSNCQGYQRLKISNDGTVDVSLKTLESRCPKILKAIKEAGLENVYKEMLDKPGFSEFFYNFCSGTRKFALNTTYSKQYQRLQKNEPVAERNSGMSIVAELLGCKNLLAHSEPAIIEKDGKTMRGTLMDFADGVDVKTIKSDNPILKQDSTCFNTKEAKKQMADLQIIDFICGNVDRHGQNMFYKFNDKNECIGIVGIDNDGSFGFTSEHENKFGRAAMQGYGNLGVISESMASRIKMITPEMLSIALKGTKISPLAVNFALNRFNILRNMVLNKDLSPEFNGNNFVKNDLTSGDSLSKINVIPDDKWDALSFDALADPKTYGEENRDNIFKYASGALDYAKNSTKTIRDEFMDSTSASFDYVTSIKSASFELASQEKSLDSGIKFYRGSSKQYNNIKKDIKEIAKAQKKLPEKPTVEELAEFKNLLNKAITDSQAYLDRKNRESQTKTFGDYTKKRIKVMKEYQAYLVDKVATIDSNYEEMVKKNDQFNTKVKQVKELKANQKNLENNNQFKEKIKDAVEVKDEIVINENSKKDIGKNINKNNDVKIDKQNEGLGTGKK